MKIMYKYIPIMQKQLVAGAGGWCKTRFLMLLSYLFLPSLP
jgi:hypothetical protein